MRLKLGEPCPWCGDEVQNGSVDLYCVNYDCPQPDPFVQTEEDVVRSPRHYTWIPGVQPIDIIEHLPYNLGAATKYLVRCGHKGSAIQDLEKALWYINREIERLRKQEEREREQSNR